MIRAILWSIFEWLCWVIFKKASSMNKTTYLIHWFLWRVPDLIISLIFIALWLVSFSIWWNIILFFLIFWFIFIWWYISEIYKWYLFKYEKMSVLLPFEKLDKIIAIIFWFIILWNESTLTFIIALFTVFIVVLLSFDFKDFRISKYVLGMIIVSIASWISLVWLWYIFLNMINFIDFYVYNAILFFLISIIYVIFKWQIKKLIWCEKKYYIYRIWGWFLWAWAFIISLFLVDSLWVVMSSLLGMIWISVTIILSRIYMNDKPSPKDLFMAFFIVWMIVLWYAFWGN